MRTRANKGGKTWTMENKGRKLRTRIEKGRQKDDEQW